MLAQDPAATDGDYMPLYQTTRDFLADPSQPLTLSLEWTDVKDASTLVPPATGPLLLPTARTLRLRIAALCRDDPTLGYFGAQDVRTGPSIQVALRNESGDETALFAPDLPSHRFRAIFLQPDPVIDPVVLFSQRAAGALNQRPGDIASRLASTLGLRNDGLTLRAGPGRRVAFGCASAIRHVIGPDGASLRFAAQSDLALHWLVVLRLTLDRDWSWDGLAPVGLVVRRDGQVVGQFEPPRNVNSDAPAAPDRTQTDLVFLDAIEPKPAAGTPPQELTPTYTVTADFRGTPSRRSAAQSRDPSAGHHAAQPGPADRLGRNRPLTLSAGRRLFLDGNTQASTLARARQPAERPPRPVLRAPAAQRPRPADLAGR